MSEETVEQLTLLQQLRAKRSDALNASFALIEKREADRTATPVADDATDEQRAAYELAETAFGDEFAKRNAEIATLEQRIAEQELVEKRRQDAATAASTTSVRITDQPLTYRSDNAAEVSYFRDLAYTDPSIRASMRGNSSEVLERLDQHGKETEGWMAKRAIERDRRAQDEIEKAEREFYTARGMRARGFDASPFERRVNPGRTQGQGGYFVPPKWLIDEYIPFLRAGRVAANLTRNVPLPEGTDSINVPRLVTPTRTAIQGADNAPVISQDIQDAAVTANVKTIAGQEDVAIQLVEQSPGKIIDQVIIEDLMADYNQRLDLQILVGNGTNSQVLNGGQMLGLYPQANWGANVATWNTATPLGNGFNQHLGAIASKTARTRYDLSGFAYIMNPSRFFWYATSLDGPSGTSGRPLVEPEAVAYNPSTFYEGNTPFEGLAGRVNFGPKVYIDDNVPLTDSGTGTPLGGANDITIGAKWDDLWLFEGDMRTRVLPEVLSGTLEIRYQIYNYAAFLVRYGASITIGQGTGYSAPVGAIDSSTTYR